MSTEYRNFLALPYEELEELNLQAKKERVSRVSIDEIREKRLKYLTDEKRIKAVTVLFSDLEGRLHLLDYDKKRMHYFEQLFHATEGWVSATSENLSLHVDMASKKVAPFPPMIMKSLARMKAAHGQLPRPEAAGRRIAMPGKG